MSQRGDSGEDSLEPILEIDPGLAEAVPPNERASAIETCLARVAPLTASRGAVEPTALLSAGLGLLVLDGLLIRRVGIDGRFGAELLGEGDLLRPWQGEEEPPSLPLRTGWRVLQSTRVALLDEDFARRLAAHPQISGQLIARALQRSRNLAVNMAIVHQARVDVRLHMLLWHLADRWGKVRGDGVALQLRLTHAVLAELLAARRPTVSSAFAELAGRGVVSSIDGGWLLIGEPPGELLELADVSVS